MKEDNLENQLRDKLGSRSITPSGDAWERLAHNRRQSKQGKKSSTVYYVAASIVVMLISGYAFLMGTRAQVEITAPGVVNTVTKPDVVPESRIVTEKQKRVVSYISKTAHKVNPIVSGTGQRTNIQAIALAKNDVNTTVTVEATVAQTIIIQKNIGKNDIYEAEANLLLEKALRDVALQRQVAAPTNDTALLKEVETEMDAYYREKAMKFFSLKYKRIRFALRGQ